MSVNKVNKTTGDLSLLAGGTLYADSPIGSIIPYGGATAPAGWFICDGTELVRATYPELFAVIGTSFGTPSDNTKFKLPDLRNKTTVGGGTLGTSSEGALPNITGGRDNTLSDMIWKGDSISRGSIQHGTPEEDYAVPPNGNLGSFAPLLFDASISSNLYKNNQSYVEPANVRVNYIIKAVSVGVPADFMSAVDNAVEEAISDIGTTDITESSALANIGTVANATQHDINVAIDSVIEDIQSTHLCSSALPSDTHTSFPITASNSITVAGVTIPQYSKGYFCAATDAMAILIDVDGYIYTCYRNINTWNKCITNAPNWIQWGEVSDLTFRTTFQNIWNAANDYSLVSFAESAGSEGSVFIQKKPGTNRTYGFFSCSTGNYELRHDAEGWYVRKITV